MKAVISKISIYQIAFFLCVFIPYFENFELTVFVWSIAAFFTVQVKYSLGIVKQLLCFIAILLIAMVVSFFKNYQLYFIIRDITYLIKPILGLLIGYQICKKNHPKAFETVIYTAIIIAIYHVLLLVYATVFHNAFTVNQIRQYGGYFSDFEVYVLIILLFHKKFELQFSKKRIRLFIILLSFSTFMYLSRTNFIQFIVLIVALKGYFTITTKSIKVVASLFLAVLIGYAAVLYINPKRNGQGLEAFLYKIKIAPIEPFKTKINRADWKDFNDNYRSYENITTVEQLSSDGLTSVLVGQGIGSTVDLKQKLQLGNVELQYISILHNGYMTVFLKSGLIGVFILLITIFLLFKKTKSTIPIINSINLLLVGSGVFMIISYWVFMGYYFKADTKSIFFGLLICYREIEIKKQLLNN